MQISCEIYYMGKQLTLAEKALGAFPADAFSSRMTRRLPTASLLSAEKIIFQMIIFSMNIEKNF